MYLQRYTKNKTNINIISSIVLASFTSLSYFIVYRIVISKLGVNFMGIWALILGYTSILSQSVSSITTNLIRKIAGYTESEFQNKFSPLIFNAIFIYLIFFASLLILVLASIFLLFPKAYLSTVSYQIIFLVIVGNFFTLLTSIFSTALDGRNKFYLKNIYLTIALVTSFIFFIVTVDTLNTWAVASMLLVQSLLSFILIFYHTRVKCNLIFSFTFFSLSDAKNILHESWKLQVSSLLVLCYEPIIKYFLSFYGLANVALYEASNKIILQIKNVFIIIIQTLLPNIVSLYKTNKEEFITYYYNLKSTIFQAALLMFATVIIILPLISLFFFKVKNDDFFLIFSILSIGSLINTIAILSHIQFIAINKINIPLLSFLAILVSLIIFCPLLGTLLGGIGVIIGVCVSLIVGSLVTILCFERLYKNKLVQKKSALFYFNCFLFCISIFTISVHIKLSLAGYLLYLVTGVGICVSSYLLFTKQIKLKIA